MVEAVVTSKQKRSRVKKICSVADCSRAGFAKNYCKVHYDRHRAGRPMLNAIIPKKKRTRFGCKIEGCNSEHKGQGYCGMHLARKYRKQPLNEPRKWREYEVGAKVINADGYVSIKIETEQGNTAWMPEHRYVMEQYLGRRLTSKESPHHLNGVKSDNRINNLELWTTSQPAGQRVLDKIKFYREEIVKLEPIEGLLVKLGEVANLEEGT